ncbi:unnamed protein product, partial [Mesorhabditis belari]|uniref:GLE1 RNA export mediator n=1 Tax=Mesorhabditis belari TaxID=2138241 RepID=A0AAF3FGP1_9BILA
MKYGLDDEDGYIDLSQKALLLEEFPSPANVKLLKVIASSAIEKPKEEVKEKEDTFVVEEKLSCYEEVDFSKDPRYPDFIEDLKKLELRSRPSTVASTKNSLNCSSLQKELIFSPENVLKVDDFGFALPRTNWIAQLHQQPKTSTPIMNVFPKLNFDISRVDLENKEKDDLDWSKNFIVAPRSVSEESGKAQLLGKAESSYDTRIQEDDVPTFLENSSILNSFATAIDEGESEYDVSERVNSSSSDAASDEDSNESRQTVEEVTTSIAALKPVTLPGTFADFYSHEIKYKRALEKKMKEFEEKTEPAMLAQIKRTVMEKVTISSKKHATKEDIENIGSYFASLCQGRPLTGVNDSEIRLSTSLEAFYMLNQACERYLKLAEHDAELCPIVSRILHSIGSKEEAFLKIVLGRLFSSCIFLTMDSVRCLKKAEWLCTQPTDARKIFVDQQRSLLRVFFTIHLLAHENEAGILRVAFKNIWRTLAYCINAPPVPLATPIVLAELLESCANELSEAYGSVWERAIECILVELLDKLDEQVSDNQLLMKAGQATYNSILRCIIDEFYK